MASPAKPDSGLARRVLPGPLHEAVIHVFDQRLSDCILVGGTALAGYYAGHRRSDDLDLFVRDDNAHRAAVLAVASLRKIGARVDEVLSSAQFFKASCVLRDHAFTTDVVLDPVVLSIDRPQVADDGVHVATLKTLLKQKAATLVSRGSEKDLYDLIWLFRRHPDVDLTQLIELGAEIDAGLTAEAALTNLVGTTLSVSACSFSLIQTGQQVFDEISAFKLELEKTLDEICRGMPAPPIGKLARKLRG